MLTVAKEFIITLITFILWSCQSHTYIYKNCDSLSYSIPTYSVLMREPINDSLFSGHVVLNFNKMDTIFHDNIACIITDICKIENLVHAYFYLKNDCVPVNDSILMHFDAFKFNQLRGCYIGKVIITDPDTNWKTEISQYDIEFFYPVIKVKW